MFDDLMKKLSIMKSITISLECDEKSYIDKQCPSEDCEFLFKVYSENWTPKMLRASCVL